jgi:hypothetical protein
MAMAFRAQALKYVKQESVFAYSSPRKYMVNVLGCFYLAPAHASLA